jgi:hypothetical protein
MQIKATYENGAINFAQPLRFKHRKFEVVVSIPEEELESGESKAPTPQAVNNKADAIRQQIDAILGPYKDQLKSCNPLTAQEYKDIWHEHLEEKYLGRR